MVKQSHFLLFFIITGIIIFAAGMAVQKSLAGTIANKIHQKPEVIANQFLERLQKAYETKNIPLLVSLYNNPTVAVDVTRNDYHFYNTSRTQREITQALTGCTGIKCSFTDRQITGAGDLIMIHTLRSVSANEIPIIAKCGMLMILRKSFINGHHWDYLVTDQILLKEEYIPKSTTGNQKKPSRINYYPFSGPKPVAANAMFATILAALQNEVHFLIK